MDWGWKCDEKVLYPTFCNYNYDAYFAKLCPTGGILGEGVERGQKRMVVEKE